MKLLIHKICGESVSIDAGDIVKVLANVSCDRHSLRLNSIQLYPIREKLVPTKFFCQRCGNIELESLIGSCTHGCGRNVELSELYLATESGGVYCERCIKRFEKSEQLVSISKIIDSVRYQ